MNKKAQLYKWDIGPIRVVETEILINAPPQKVWKVLTDFSRYPEWNPVMTKIEGNAKPGEKITVKMYMGKMSMTFKPRIIACLPNRELRWFGKIGAPFLFSGDHIFMLGPVGKKTRLIHKEQFRGILVPLLMMPYFVKKTRKAFMDMNESLRKRVEKR